MDNSLRLDNIFSTSRKKKLLDDEDEDYKPYKLNGPAVDTNPHNYAGSGFELRPGFNTAWGVDSYKHDPKDKLTEYQKALIEEKRAELGSKTKLGQDKLDLSQQDIDIRRRKAELAEKIADGKATDAEKQEYELHKIAAKGAIGDEQIDRKGAITSRQIGERGKITSDQIDQRGSITSKQIQERGAIGDRQINERGDQQRRTQELRGSQQSELQDQRNEGSLAAIAERARLAAPKSPTPSAKRTETRANFDRMTTTRPELAKLTTRNSDGSIAISDQATPEQQKEIERLLYPPINNDINLEDDSEPRKPKKATKAKTPEVTSKYKVTVE